MAQPVIVTGGAPEGNSDQLAVVVGATTVVAATAAEEAAQAAQDAERANDRIDSVADAAFDAQAAIYRLEAGQDALEEKVMEALGGIVEALGPAVIEAADDGAPERDAPAAEPEAKPDDKPTKTKREHSGKYGSDSWFGNRD